MVSHRGSGSGEIVVETVSMTLIATQVVKLVTNSVGGGQSESLEHQQQRQCGQFL